MYVEKNKKSTLDAGKEIADVINLLFAVATKLEIDVEKEFLEKEEKNNKRVYHRSPKK